MNSIGETVAAVQKTATSDKLLWKGFLTIGLILGLMIPMILIFNMVEEREKRQQEVVKEVSSKWAGDQTLSGLFLSIPYKENATDDEGKPVVTSTPTIIIPAEMAADAELKTEIRERSIYKVLLYTADVNFKGHFKSQFQQSFKPENFDLANAKICFGLSDYKGIESIPQLTVNGRELTLDPGLPVNALGSTGLSAPLPLTQNIFDSGIHFTLKLKLKGSSRLHFLPLAATGQYHIHSAWPSPSFDGNRLPGERMVSDSGFNASWTFNKANLPFGMATKDGAFKPEGTGFGVSLLQPADHYDKTIRSVKYAILLIGLTFGLFFIVEILQKNPVHPIQYGLVGVALLVFYTLLLSISEYLFFDRAYLIAALATVSLISLYAKAHFKSWKVAGIFFAILSLLYGFVFVLIRLEDTALIVGSIGLFIIVAIMMYASRKVNWYGSRKN